MERPAEVLHLDRAVRSSPRVRDSLEPTLDELCPARQPSLVCQTLRPMAVGSCTPSRCGELGGSRSKKWVGLDGVTEQVSNERSYEIDMFGVGTPSEPFPGCDGNGVQIPTNVSATGLGRPSYGQARSAFEARDGGWTPPPSTTLRPRTPRRVRSPARLLQA